MILYGGFGLNYYQLYQACIHLTFCSVVLCLTFRPDGEELAVASLDGQITFWNIRGVVQTGSVEGRRDLQVGRSVEHKVTAKHLAGGRCDDITLWIT